MVYGQDLQTWAHIHILPTYGKITEYVIILSSQ